MRNSFTGQSVLEGTTRNDGRAPPSAVLWRTGPLLAPCDLTGQTGNCEHAQTGVEQRIAALYFLAEAISFNVGRWTAVGRDWGAV